MVNNQAVFKYKTIKGFMHNIPALVKILLLLPLSVICISLPPVWLCAGTAAVFITAYLAGITIREQLTDLKPAAFYALLMYLISILSSVIDNPSLYDSAHLTYNNLKIMLSLILILRADFIQIILRLILILQMSALLFRTTSPVEIRDAVRLEIISLFLLFIPEIFNTWAQIDLAWKARGGKNGLSKIYKLVLIIISASFEKAAIKAKAVEARKGIYEK